MCEVSLDDDDDDTAQYLNVYLHRNESFFFTYKGYHYCSIKLTRAKYK